MTTHTVLFKKDSPRRIDRMIDYFGESMPGMYAQVKFTVVPAAPALIVPATTLVIGAGGTKVMAVRDDDTVQSKKIELGRDLGRVVEVVSGRAGTERLVANPPDGLKDGDRVVLAPENRTGETPHDQT